MSELQRGANVALTRENPTLEKLVIGVEWRAKDKETMAKVQLGALLLKDGAIQRGENVIFFNQMKAMDDSVSMGDDCEQLLVDIPLISPSIDAIDVIVWMNNPSDHLSSLDTLSVRAFDASTERQLVRTENYAKMIQDERAFCLVQLYRHGGEWKLRSKGAGWKNGMEGVVKAYDIEQS